MGGSFQTVKVTRFDGVMGGRTIAGNLKRNLSERQLSVSNLSELQLSEDFLLSKICIGVAGAGTEERLKVLIHSRG